MLKALHVKNLALIEEADIAFDEGLTIFSGETGAGKSILLESIHLALGGRASRELIRTDKEFALVELTFQPKQAEVLSWLKAHDIWTEDGDVVITRKLTADKSVMRINGETVNATLAREVGEHLLDIHGQNEHQSLLKKSHHGKILDAFGKEAIADVKAKIAASYARYKEVCSSLAHMETLDQDRSREIGFCEYEIQEIEVAAVQEGEEEELTALYAKLSNGRKILQAVGTAHEMLSDRAEDSVGMASRELSSLSGIDKDIDALQEQLLIVEASLGEISQGLRSYMDDFSFDEELLRETHDRLDLIHDLQKKYGKDYNAMMTHLAETKARLDELLHLDEEKERLIAEKQQLEKTLRSDSAVLTELRQNAATVLEQQISLHLQELNFLSVMFRVSVTPKETFAADGMDSIEFMISMNKGESPKALEHVASGGELSRIMLAMKTVLVALDPIETQIFDEIDAGISGITASCVAKKLRQIAGLRQVFCISHLPQIVAAADHHYLIEKQMDDNRTYTHVTSLDEEGSVRELARILGGDQITESTLQAAKELKNHKEL